MRKNNSSYSNNTGVHLVLSLSELELYFHSMITLPSAFVLDWLIGYLVSMATAWRIGEWLMERWADGERME